MQKKTMFLLYCVLAFTQFSCTSVLFVDATKPAEVAVANTQWKVAVINRFNPDLLDINREKKTQVFKDGASHAFWGAIDAILDDDTYALVFIDSLSYKTPIRNSNLSPQQVQDLYVQQPHHLLLSLEHFDTYFSHETAQEEDEDGTVSKTAHYKLAVASTWALYDSTGQIMDKFKVIEHAPYQSRAVVSGLLAIGPSMSNAGTAVNDLAWYSGNSYWSRLAPQHVYFARSYYSTKNFQAAAVALADGDWEKSIALLEPLTKSKNQKEAGRASYNMAITYEAIGDIEQAKFWASEALRQKEKLSAYLLQELERY